MRMKTDAYHSMMLDYASGALSPEMALAAELHILLNRDAETESALWDAVGQSIVGPSMHKTADDSLLPEALELACSRFETVPWRKGLSGVHYAKRGKNRGQLMRLDPGQSAPAHGHSAYEATVVLRGRFNDGRGEYRRGDMVVAGPGDHHQPSGTGDEMCVCFVGREPRPFWRLS